MVGKYLHGKQEGNYPSPPPQKAKGPCVGVLTVTNVHKTDYLLWRVRRYFIRAFLSKLAQAQRNKVPVVNLEYLDASSQLRDSSIHIHMH